MQIRAPTAEDYTSIIGVVDAWWGGRAMAAMLPKLFFVHFQNTSFIAEADGERIGFLVGFLSPTLLNEAYIHFVGVHPGYRKSGVARALYERFFRLASETGRQRVRCVTSPVNSSSIAFHRALGFHPDGGNWSDNTLPIHQDYDGPGEDRVLLVRKL